MPQERRARVAVIGTGWWSTYTHIPGLKNNPDANLVALSDVNAEKLKGAAQYYEVGKTYTNFHEMLANEALDGVVIATNHASHYQIVKECLQRGLHIMVEKPMVLRARDAHELLQLAKQKHKEIIVGYPYHYTPLTKRARDVLASGELGPIQYVVCHMASMVIEFYRGNPDAYDPVFKFPVYSPGRVYNDPKLSGGGQGHLQITHSAGSMFFITGLRAQRVSGFMEKFDLPVDLVDAMSVRFEGGAVGIVGSTGNVGVGDRGQLEIDVYCANGYLLLDQINGQLYIRRHNGKEESIGPLPADQAYPRFATANNLVEVILDKAPNGSPGEVGARTVELLDAAYRSAEHSGRPVSVTEL